jgi:cell division protein FtsI (penicillin-binding protein 3)
VRLVERRIGLLFALFLVLLSGAVLRAFWIGTVRAGSLKERALTQQVEDMSVSARRGTISDRHGIELAVSEDAASVYANPFLIKRPARVAAKLAPLLDRSPEQLLQVLAERDRGFVYLRRKVDADVGVKVDRLRLAGIGTVTEPRRVYPQGALASQVIGSVGTDNYGLSGIEQQYEDKLHGEDGKRRLVKDAMGEPVSLVETHRSKPGEDLRLTLDSTLQQRVEDVLAGVGQTYRPRGATAVVIDPRSGAVLALANWPRVDANDIGAAPAYARQDRAVTASYEPGSTFKAFTVSGALSERLITPHTAFDLPPTIQVADRTIKEAHDGGFGRLTVADILARSSNVGSVMIGLRLGARKFDGWVHSFGFGRPTDVGLPGEAPGIVPRANQYSGSSMGNLPIGQGLAVTPIQMAAAYTAIARHGVLHDPYLIAGQERGGRRVLSRGVADQVSRMLEGVLGPGGTAEEASVPGYRLAGKTGTAQKAEAGGYSKTRFVASFIGYAPARDPRVLVAVMVDEPKGDIYGGEVAAPAFEKIVSFALPYLRIPPDGGGGGPG